jgi:AcrR family transcriptional regulator
MTTASSNIKEKKIKLSRRERKAQRVRQRILDSARELFENQTYDDVKMDDISERVDLSRATLYNYFGSKEALYFEIGIQNLRSLHDGQKKVILQEASGINQINALCEDILTSLFEQPILHEIMRQYLLANAQAETPSHEVLRKIEEGEKVEPSTSVILASFLREMRVFEETWVDAIKRGCEDSSIQHELEAEQLTHFLFLIILGIVDRVDLERVMLQHMGLNIERIKSLTVNLVQKYLETSTVQESMHTHL